MREAIKGGGFDAVCFTSSSTVRNLVGIAGKPHAKTVVAVIGPQIAFALPTTIIILVPFLRAIPAELEDAALIDGAGRFTFFWRVLLPLSWPGLITVGVLAFVASWNAYLLPLLHEVVR